jgi:hypothetical protein
MSRKRAYIPYPERLAAALAELLPAEVAIELRARQAPARAVIRLFTNDHIHLHALGGSDKWWNLHARLRGVEVLTKNARDTSIVAKVKRIDKKWGPFMAAIAAGQKPPKRTSQFRKGRKLQSRNNLRKAQR